MGTRIASFNIEGVSAVSFSRYHEAPKLSNKEDKGEYEQRTWREKAHYDEKTGEVYISPMAFKKAIAEAAKRLSISIPGKGKQKYTKNIVSGIIASDNVYIGVRKDDLQSETFHCDAQGDKAGKGKRVKRTFPIVPPGWKGTVVLYLIDDEIPEDVIERPMAEAGTLAGGGRFRPENGGFLGRFAVKGVSWQTQG